MSIIEDMQRDHESIQDYHSLEIMDTWCRAGGSLADLHDTLAFWAKCEEVARRRAGVDLLWCHLAEVAEELIAEAKAALRADRIEDLARTWWPAGVPAATAKASW